MNKYRAKKTRVGSHVFDSKKEAARFCELQWLEKAGVISDLELQPRFKLEADGGPIRYDSGRQAEYRADFKYVDVATDKVVVEDAKGFRTKEYKLKRAIVHAMYPDIRIVEV